METKSAKNQAPARTADETAKFEARHEKDLSAKRFAYVAGMQTLIPLATAAAAGAIGWFALATPLRKMMPNFFRGFGDVADLTKHIYKMTPAEVLAGKDEIARIAPETIKRIREGGPGISNAIPDFEVNSIQSLIKLARETTKEEMHALKAAFGVVGESEITASKAFAGGGAAMVGSMVGGVAVGYDKWRKDESERLAAEEINRDISRIELFRPSNPELVAENKRLRAMVDAKPQVQAGSVKLEGRATEQAEQQIA